MNGCSIPLPRGLIHSRGTSFSTLATSVRPMSLALQTYCPFSVLLSKATILSVCPATAASTAAFPGHVGFVNVRFGSDVGGAALEQGEFNAPDLGPGLSFDGFRQHGAQAAQLGVAKDVLVS